MRSDAGLKLTMFASLSSTMTPTGSVSSTSRSNRCDRSAFSSARLRSVMSKAVPTMRSGRPAGSRSNSPRTRSTRSTPSASSVRYSVSKGPPVSMVRRRSSIIRSRSAGWIRFHASSRGRGPYRTSPSPSSVARSIWTTPVRRSSSHARIWPIRCASSNTRCVSRSARSVSFTRLTSINAAMARTARPRSSRSMSARVTTCAQLPSRRRNRYSLVQPGAPLEIAWSLSATARWRSSGWIRSVHQEPSVPTSSGG